MNEKVHNVLRMLQWLLPAAATLYAALDKTFQWGYLIPVETVTAAVVTFIGVLAQHSSTVFFSDKKIVVDYADGNEQEEGV